MKKRIEQIRGLLRDNKINEAYDMMISLNEFDERVDNYTCYFINSLDLDKETLGALYDDVDKDNGSILVECVLCGYMYATSFDLEDTLQEIEYNLL